MKMSRVGTVVALLLLAAPSAGTAQSRPGPERREQLEMRVRERFGEIVQRELGLSNDEMRRVQDVFAEFQEARARLHLQERSLRRRLAPGRAEAGVLSDAEALSLIEEAQELRLREARLFVEEQERMLELLTPSQLVRLYQIRETLMARIRRMRGGGAGPPGGGGPPWEEGGAPWGPGGLLLP